MSSTSATAGRLAGVRVLIIGDVMLDRYVYGRVDRMSPEAPIPVLAVERESAMAGGAANVARNVAALGGGAVLLGAVGADDGAAALQAMLAGEAGVTADLLPCADRPTTRKTRFIADRQQLLRTDREHAAPLGAAEAAELVARCGRALPGVDAVILSDYAKGVLSPPVLRAVIAAAAAAGKPIVADPKARDLARYDGVTVLTPNRGEAAAATGMAIDDDAGAARAAQRILELAPALGAALVTRGAQGMTLAVRGQTAVHVPTAAREVFDVSGAGDTVAAVLALALGAGAEIEAAARLANVAAGVAVSKVGTAVVRPDELQAALAPTARRGKVLDRPALLEAAAQWRAAGETIGFTNGCFDLLHPGHVSLLAQARAACDRLVVGLNTDASVRRLKGPARPVQNEQSRATVLAALADVAAVTLFDEDTPAELIRALRPDVLVKGADYTIDRVVGAEFVQGYGGRVVLAELAAGHSTTGTIARMGRDAA